MTIIDKRNLLLGAAAAALAGVGLMVATQSRKAATQSHAAHSPRELMRERHFPNVPLVTHEGKQVMFYDDLFKDKKVVINMMYTVCSGICTPATYNIVEARKLLGNFARDIHFYSLSLTPLDDDPPALRAYMKSFGITAGWTFLTGKPENVERVRRGLGFARTSAAKDADITNHSGMLRIGNEPWVSWSHSSTMVSGRATARMIRFALT